MLSKEQAMSLFHKRHQRTAVIQLSREGGLYRHKEKEKLLACNLTAQGFIATKTIQKLQTFVFF